MTRELDEEIGADVIVDALAFVVENFFDWSGDMVHEIGLCYYARFHGDSLLFYERSAFDGIEGKMEGSSEFRLHFKWFSVSDVPHLNVKPDFLKTMLQAEPAPFAHVVNRA